MTALYEIPVSTEQEFFDKTCEFLAQQKKQCRGSTGLCLYENNIGLHCGIGWAIKPRTDANTVYELGNQSILSLINGTVETTLDPSFLVDMQNAHDSSPTSTLGLRARTSLCLDRITPLGVLKWALYQIAKRYRLNDSAVKLITEWSIG